MHIELEERARLTPRLVDNEFVEGEGVRHDQVLVGLGLELGLGLRLGLGLGLGLVLGLGRGLGLGLG